MSASTLFIFLLIIKQTFIILWAEIIYGSGGRGTDAGRMETLTMQFAAGAVPQLNMEPLTM